MGCGSSKSSKTDASNTAPKAKVIFVVGGPGSGKGTQCERIAKHYKLAHLSTGDIFREERKKGGELGDELDKIMTEGKLVSSELCVKLLRKSMQDKGWEKSTFLLDGFPRSAENIKEWKKQMGKDTHVLCMLNFDCPDDILV